MKSLLGAEILGMAQSLFVDVRPQPGPCGTVMMPCSMAGTCMARSSFQGTSSMSAP